jgi:hypothetical protein
MHLRQGLTELRLEGMGLANANQLRWEYQTQELKE